MAKLYYLSTPEQDEVNFEILIHDAVTLNQYAGTQATLAVRSRSAFEGSETPVNAGHYFERSAMSYEGYVVLNRLDLADYSKGIIYQLAAEATKNDNAQLKVPALRVQLINDTNTIEKVMIIRNTYYIPPSLGIMIESARMLIREVSRTCYGLSDEERMRALLIDPTDDTLRELEPSLWVALIRGGITRSEMLGTSSSTWRDPNIMRLQLSEGKKATAQFIRMYLDIK